MLNDFIDWLSDNTNLSERSIKRYESGVRVVSKEMLMKKIISVPLENMSPTQMEIAIFNIFLDEDFIKKDSVGKGMYSNSLKHFLSFIKDTCGNIQIFDEEINRIENDENLSVTEKESIVKSRIGQGSFRKKIIQKYEGKCIVSGVSDSRLLVASHVKPWAVSDNTNRTSADNGLLLNALYDKMFDLGLITFTENSMIVVSNELKLSNQSLIQLKTHKVYPLKYTVELLRNMEYHRDVVFLKGKVA